MPPLPEGQPPGGVEEHASREALRERARARGATDRCVGIHALEVYTPRHAAYAKQLEDEHGVPGKYTDGLLMEAYCGPDWDEDPVSMALTVVSRLLWRNNIRHTDIGMIQVGSESLLDASKSIKSNLMALFEAHGVTDIQGTDQYNACYGGTAALLNCFNWVQSASWDGRWALAVATDIADAPPQYRFMVGAAATAMLVGPDGPLELQRERVSHILDRWDFYKPVGWHEMAPVVDGPYSIEVYFSCLDSCQRQIGERAGFVNLIESNDYIVYHLGSGPKFVKHAFERSCAMAFATDEAARHLEAEHQWGEYATPRKGTARQKFAGMRQAKQDRLFDEKVGPSLCLAARIGPMHTAAAYTNLTSLLLEKREDLLGKSIAVFSYGSGAASTLYRLQVRRLPVTNWNKHEELDKRIYHSAAEFDRICARYADTYGRFGWKAEVSHPQHPGAYYLTECDSLGRRAYHLVRDPEMRLRGPTLITIQKPEGGWALDDESQQADEAQQAGDVQQAEEGQDAGEGVVAPTAPSRV